jgi:hypothetical protein
VVKALFLLYIHVNQKLKYMIYKLAISNDRVKYLVKELGNNIKVIREGDNTTILEVTVNSDMDALCLFHAGVYSGLNSLSK